MESKHMETVNYLEQLWRIVYCMRTHSSNIQILSERRISGEPHGWKRRNRNNTIVGVSLLKKADDGGKDEMNG